MKDMNQRQIRDLIERIARLNSAEEWTDDLNPTQRTALSYLSQANRFSRSPSQVAEFMAATRGTVSQTLKALARKELISEIRSQLDRRWISYEVTSKGKRTINNPKAIDDALNSINPTVTATLADGLENLLREALRLRGRKQFGLCKNCKYHRKENSGGYCLLLEEKLKAEEVNQICHEYLEPSSQA